MMFVRREISFAGGLALWAAIAWCARRRPRPRWRPSRPRSRSIATCGRFFPTSAFSATGLTRPSGRPSCGSTSRTAPSAIETASDRSCRATRPRATWSAGIDQHRSRRADAAARARARSSRQPRSTSSLAGSTRRRVWQRHWAFIPPERPTLPAVKAPAMGAQSDRRVRAGPAGGGRAGALGRGRPSHAHPPRDARPDRPAADAGGGRRVSGRRLAGRLRAAGRSAAGFAPLRRADGGRAGWTPPATPTPTAIRPTASAYMWRWRDWVIDAFNRNLPFDQFTDRAARRRPAARRHARPADRHRLQPQPSRQRRGGHHPRGVRGRVRRRSRRDDRHGLAGPDHGLRAAATITSSTRSRSTSSTSSSPSSTTCRRRAGRSSTATRRRSSRRRPATSSGSWPALDEQLAAAERAFAATEPTRLAARQAAVGRRRHRQRTARLVAGRGPGRPFPARRQADERLGGEPAQAAGTVDVREPARSARPPCSTDAASLDAGDVADFGFFDKFTLAAWIRPRARAAAPSCRGWPTEADADGYSRAIWPTASLQVNLVKRWLDDALRVETEPSRSRSTAGSTWR